VIAQRYHILSKLGEGGMGVVYLAEQVPMGRWCAVKVMRARARHDDESISRFQREAANASRINHPNVAAIYDFGEAENDILYLAMEFVEGETLSAIVQREHVLRPARAVEISLQIAEALAAAHELGIVHRDLKPDNIMITRVRGRETVKVVDFGIAKVTQGSRETLTRTGYVVGTPAYMSPEQLSGEPLDGRSDVYSLGCILYELLTGQRAFARSSAEVSLRRRLEEHSPRPRKVQRHLARSLDRLVSKALARAPEHRFDSALALRDALISAREENEVKRGWRDRLSWGRLHQASVKTDRQTATKEERPRSWCLPENPQPGTIPVPLGWEVVQQPVPQEAPPEPVIPAGHDHRRWSGMPRVAPLGLIAVLLSAAAWRFFGAVQPATNPTAAVQVTAESLLQQRSHSVEPMSAQPVSPADSEATNGIGLTNPPPLETEPVAPAPAPTPARSARVPAPEPATGKIVVLGSIPAGAELSLDGRRLQPDERVLIVAPGLHWIGISAPGRVPDSASAEVHAGARVDWIAPELRLTPVQTERETAHPPVPAASRQTSPEAEPPPQIVASRIRAVLPAGTGFPALTDTEIRSHKTKVGKKVTATVPDDVKDASGRVTIPAGSRVTLKVRAIRISKTNSNTSGIVTLEPIALSINGSARQLRASISGLKPHLEPRPTRGSDAAKVGAGVAVGGLVGRVLGGSTTGAVVGGILGGAVGAQRAAETKDVDVVLPQGTVVTVTLERDLVTQVAPASSKP
jgi:serine/threonine protein kinase